MKKGVIKRLWRVAGKYKVAFIASIICSSVFVLLNLYLPILFGKATDLIVGKGQVDLEGILKIGISGAICALIAGIAQWINDGLCSKIAHGITKNLRVSAFNKLQKLPLSYIDSREVGELLSVEISDADKMSEGLLLGFSKFFIGALTIVVTLIFMLSINPIIAGVVAIITPISLFVAKFITGRTYKYFKNQSEKTGKQTAFIEESLTNLTTVKAYSLEEDFGKEFDNMNEDLKKTSFKAVFFSSLTNPVTRFVNSLVYSAVAFTGAMIALSGGDGVFALTAGSILALLSYANRYTKPFNEITSVMTELSGATACASRIFSVIDEVEEGDLGNTRFDSVNGDVEIKGVSFSYDKSKKLIENFNLEARKGEKIAIVGPTGCGKTTLINLLMRFYEVDGGEIKVDGVNIVDATRKSLRKSYGMVLQDTWIRNATVRENIIIGKKDATEEEVVKASKMANAHGFIKRLPQGYDTVISENSLSQGQKQLLCIARVMLSLPPMLILDEATSSIDTRTEMKIQEAFDTLTKGKTSFIVAHRLSTVKNADKILVMKDGNVIEQGSHGELIERGGFYSKLYASQFQK